GLITLFWASLNATRQQDLKGILAFSTVSQLGMIMSMLGIGAVSYHFEGAESQLYVAGFTAAVFHLINHATFKGALFMITGAVDHTTGTRNVKKLGGLLTIMPISFTITIITSLSMAGVPPFNGFLSKEKFLKSMIEVTNVNLFSLNTIGFLIPIVAIIGSIFTFVYSVRFIGQIFLGSHKEDALPKKAHEASLLMLVSPAILAVLVIVFGFFPSLLTGSIIDPAVNSISQTANTNSSFYMFHGFTPAFFSTISIYIVGALLIFSFAYWVRLLQAHPTKLTINYWYDKFGAETSGYSSQFTNAYVTGFTRNNLIIIFISLIVIALATLLVSPFNINFKDVSEVRPFELIIVVIIITAASMIIFAHSRLFSIIMASAVGYAVAIFFIFFGAPDLALTQFVVESI